MRGSCVEVARPVRLNERLQFGGGRVFTQVNIGHSFRFKVLDTGKPHRRFHKPGRSGEHCSPDPRNQASKSRAVSTTLECVGNHSLSKVATMWLVPPKRPSILAVSVPTFLLLSGASSGTRAMGLLTAVVA